jgi:uncharacterized lipoprotein (TIGR02269 family)
MRLSRSWRWLTLLCVLWTACATPVPAARAEGEEGEPWEPVASSWEEARADASCVVPLCGETGCAIWRCRDVVEQEEAPRVLLAQAVMEPPMVEMEPMLRSPGTPSRWWGRPLAVPGGAEPVFEIPWHNWNAREQYAPKVLRPPCVHSWEPLEKHHIFPQEFAKWFKGKEIDIHAFTVRVPRSFQPKRMRSGSSRENSC